MRNLITQSLLSSWLYTFDCAEGSEEEARAEFMQALRREKGEPSEAMLNGIEFESNVYEVAAGVQRLPHPQWEAGIQKVAAIIRGAPVQVKLSRELETAGKRFLVYGIADAVQAGVIYDVKFKNSSLGRADVYGHYLESPQHPTYLYCLPEAYEFRYLVSDGQDLYTESYARKDVRPLFAILNAFVTYLDRVGLMALYDELWQAQ